MPIIGQLIPRMEPKYWIAIGFSIIAVAMWYSTSLVPDASFSYFATVRVFQTVGMPFLFIPINSVAYTGLPPQKTNEGSALINVARNLGGSIGVSLANTELVQRSQFHQSRLVENLIPVLAGISIHAAQSHRSTSRRADRPPTRRAVRSAISPSWSTIRPRCMAYIDIFYSWCIFAIVLVPLVLC